MEASVSSVDTIAACALLSVHLPLLCHSTANICAYISKYAFGVPAQNQADHILMQPSILWKENQAKGRKP